jgi:Mg2+/Co2+ transporter CorC
MRNIKRVPKNRWDATRVDKIMIPASEVRTAQSEQSAISLLEQIDDLEIDYIPVLEEDEVTGIVIRDTLIRLSKIRAELGI